MPREKNKKLKGNCALNFKSSPHSGGITEVTPRVPCAEGWAAGCWGVYATSNPDTSSEVGEA